MKFSYRVFTFFIFFACTAPTNSCCITPSCLIGSYALCVGCCLAYTDYEVESAATKNGLEFKAIDGKIETISKNFQALITVLAPHLKTLGNNQRTLAQALHLPIGNLNRTQAISNQQPPHHATALRVAIPHYNPNGTPTSQTPPPPPGALSQNIKTTAPTIMHMTDKYHELPTNSPKAASFSVEKHSKDSDSVATSSTDYNECQ